MILTSTIIMTIQGLNTCINIYIDGSSCVSRLVGESCVYRLFVFSFGHLLVDGSRSTLSSFSPLIFFHNILSFFLLLTLACSRQVCVHECFFCGM
jgi:hypothetical protein